MKQMKTAIILF